MSNATFIEGIEGRFPGLEESIYRAAPGINVSALKDMQRSPAHFLAASQGVKKEATESQQFGTLVHAAVLEPSRFGDLFVVRPEGMKFTTKEGKAWKEAQTKPIMDQADIDNVLRCALAIVDHPQAGRALVGGEKEISVFKVCPITGLLRKGRLDLLTEDAQGFLTIADIKTTDDASPEGFAKAVAKWRYDVQAAFYMDLVDAEFFLFIAVEKTAPFAVGVYALDAESIEHGRRAYLTYLDRLAECQEKNHWPAYSDGIETLSLPRWAMFK